MLKSKNKTLLARAAMTLLFALLTTVGAWAQVTLTVCDGTATNSNVPVHGLWADAYLKCEFVVPAAELEDMVGGTISQMTFYLSSPAAAAWTGTFKVFLMEVDDATISAYYGSDDATVVYEGQLDGTQSTMTIEFSDTYTYGGGNLLVGVYQIVKGNYKGCTFSGETVNGASVQGYSSSSLDAISASQKNFIPKTTFTYTPGIGVCIKPSVSVSGITNKSATLTLSGGSETYNVEYKKTTDENWTTVATNSTETSFNLTGLSALTAYDVRVQSVCDGSATSDWKTTSFTTTAIAEAVGNSWSDDFEGASCGWELVNGTCTNAWAWGTAVNNGGTHALYISNDGGTTNAYTNNAAAMVYATKLLIFADGKYEFSYDWLANGEGTWDYLRVALVPASVSLTASTNPPTVTSGSFYDNLPTGWIALDGGSKLNLVTAWQNKSVAIDVTAGNYYLVVAWRNDTSSGDNPPAAIDNVSINKVACAYEVTGLAVSDITTSGATLAWTAGGATQWQVAYSTKSNFEGATEEIVNTASCTLSGLKLSTHYYAKVRSYCGGEDFGSWSAVLEFKTACEALTEYPYSENFDNYTHTTNTTSVNILPDCWNYINTTSYSSYKGYPMVFYGSGYAHSGDYSLRFYSYAYYSDGNTNYDPQDQYAILPPMENLAGKQISLYARGYNTNSTFKIGTMSNPTDESTFTVIATQDGLSTSYPTDAFEYIIPSTCTDSYVAIMMEAANSSRTTNGVYIDDITIADAPTCIKPTGVTTSDVTAHGATLNWVSDASAWQIMLNDDEENLIDVTEKPYTLTGLAPETNYSVKVRTDCGSGSFSEWTNPVSFTTTVACTAPTGIAVSNIAGHSATVTWDAEEGDVFEYALAQNVDKDGNEKVPSDLQYQTVSEIPLTLTGLDPETSYTFYLRKNCGSVDGYSQIVTRNFTTTIACPAPAVTVSNITTTTAEVSCTNTEADYFNVSLDDVLIAENVTMPYTLTDLVPSTSYTVKVQAICGGEDGESAWSAGTTFMTADICPEGMVCIGTGTTTSSYLPAYNYYKYSYTQQIYTADEIGMDGQISSIEFKNTGAEKTMNCNIYMTATNKTAFESSSDWVPLSDDDLVFSGEITFAVGEWTSIELENPFEYNGTSNLLVTVANVSGTYSSSPHMACLTFLATNQALYAYRDSPGAYDITAPDVTGTRATFKNRVRFAIGEPPACAKPKKLEVSEIGRKSAKLSWTPGAEGQSAWQICVNGDEDNLIEADTNPFALTGLTPETEYTVKVRANCGDDGFSDWSKEVTLTTEIACPAPTNLMASNISTSSATLSWNSLSNNTELRYAANSYQVFQGYVTNPGAMADGSDASWVQGDQLTWGPGVQYTHGNMLADDFTVYTPIKLSEIEVYGYQTGSTTTSTFTGLYAQIFDGNPADGGTAIWGDMDTNIMTGTSFTNCYRGTNGNANGMTRPIMAITASNLNIELEPGTYWLVYSLEGTESSGPYGVPNAEPNVGNTGEGLQYTSSNWTYLVDSDSYTSYGCAMKLTFGVDIESLEWTYVNNINGEECNLTNLDPNTPYIVQIRSNYGDDGNSTWVSTYFYTQGTAEITFAAEGYATYFNGLQDAVLPAGMKAKIVTVAEAAGSEDATLTYDIVANGDYADGNVVPKKTAVMLQVAPVSGTATQKKTIILTMPSAAAINKTNLLYGSDEEMEIEDHPSYADDKYYYMLSYDTNNANIGWYWGAAGGGSFTSLAHKAWLALPSNLFPSQGGAPFLGLPGWEETTGIVPVGVNPEDGEWYTLQGLKIGKKPTTKGVYIHNGRKVIIK